MMLSQISRRNSLAAFSFAVAACGAAVPASAHSDVVPSVAGGRLVTGGHDDETGQDVTRARAFGFDFGEEPADPYFIADPGFNAPAGALPGGSTLSFAVPAAAAVGLPRALSYWSGSGAVSFSPVPSGESLVLSLGAQATTITGGVTGPVAGFSIGTAAANGSVHRHLGSALLGADGDSTAGDGVEPAAGVYVVALRLSSSDPTVSAADPIWVVYNNGLTEAQHDAAIGFVERALAVPEPGSAGVAGAGAGLLALARRRRRRRRA